MAAERRRSGENNTENYIWFADFLTEKQIFSILQDADETTPPSAPLHRGEFLKGKHLALEGEF